MKKVILTPNPYRDKDFQTVREAARILKEAGVEGVVIGVLDIDGNLDMPKMRELMKEAEGMSVTLHRAFDMCRDPYQALEEAITLGINTILTSGQKQSAWEGRELLTELVEKADGRIDIMVGAGIGASVIEKLIPITKGSSYHMSGKVTLDSPMKYRKEEVSMGLPSLSEYEIWQTSEEYVRAAVNVFKQL